MPYFQHVTYYCCSCHRSLTNHKLLQRHEKERELNVVTLLRLRGKNMKYQLMRNNTSLKALSTVLNTCK